MATNPVSRAALAGLFGVDEEGWDRHKAHSRGERQFTKNFDQVGPYGTVGKNLGKNKTGMTPGEVPGVSRAQGQRDKMANFMSQMPTENQLSPGRVRNAARAGQLHNLGQAVKGSGRSKYGYKGSWDRNMQDIDAIQQQLEDALVTLAGNKGVYTDVDPFSRDMGTMSVMGTSGVRGASPHFGMTALPGHIAARGRSRSRAEKDDEDPYSEHTKAMNPTAVTGFKGLLGLPGRAPATTRATATPVATPATAPVAAPTRAIAAPARRDDGVSDHDPYGHKAAAEAAKARKSSMARAAKARSKAKASKSGGGRSRGKGRTTAAPVRGHHRGGGMSSSASAAASGFGTSSKGEFDGGYGDAGMGEGLGCFGGWT